MTPLLLTVSSGVGPIEVREFVRELAEALRREVGHRGLSVEGVCVHGPPEAPSSVDLSMLGERARFADLIGTHVLVLQSDRREKRDRKRWYAGVRCEERAVDTTAALDVRDVVFE